MSYIRSPLKCAGCGHEMNVAFGVVDPDPTDDHGPIYLCAESMKGVPEIRLAYGPAAQHVTDLRAILAYLESLEADRKQVRVEAECMSASAARLARAAKDTPHG